MLHISPFSKERGSLRFSSEKIALNSTTKICYLVQIVLNLLTFYLVLYNSYNIFKIFATLCQIINTLKMLEYNYKYNSIKENGQHSQEDNEFFNYPDPRVDEVFRLFNMI
jgi:hypothetical protein